MIPHDHSRVQAENAPDPANPSRAPIATPIAELTAAGDASGVCAICH